MLENHLQSKWNIPFLDTAHPRAGKTPDFSGAAVGADVSIYWGLSDGGENKAAWDNVARIGNIFRKDTTANSIELRGYDAFREENYFDLARQDKGYLGVAASGVGVLTNGPGNRGYDFNNDSDFINAGIGITHGDNFGDMGIGYFTAQEAGAHTFGYTGVDDRALFCLDLDQDGQFEWNRIRTGKFSAPETGQHGRFRVSYRLSLTRIKEQSILVPVSISLWSCTRIWGRFRN